MFVLFAVLFLSIAAAADNPNACGQWPTCAECLQHNLCGWCSTNVIYEDGTPGPHCAGKPKDPDNPPPGFKKWICPKDYQNKACYGYVCDQTSYQCVSSGAPGKGVPLAECMAKCFPPTYLCNTTTWTCDQTTPGHGTDKPSCEGSCKNNTYTCDNNATCVPAKNGGGQPLGDCNTSCKASNSTPANILGDYRGLEVSNGYIKGEWQAKLAQGSVTITKPDGSTWAQGVLLTFQQQLWVQTSAGTRKGIFTTTNTPEVQALTWALGDLGAPAPSDWNLAMQNQTVLVLYKCLNSQNCKFSVAGVFEYLNFQEEEELRQEIVTKKQKRQSLLDPCMVYPDCQTCVSSKNYCGWCSVNVVYNGTIEGKQCAGVNKSITHATFNCTGSFSIESCLPPTTTAQTTTSSTGKATTTTTGGGKSTGTTSKTTTTSSTTGSSDKYICDPTTLTCKKNQNGIPLQTCKDQCKSVPIVPIQLRNKFFRGLQINQGYLKGEWDANFTETDVTVWDSQGKMIKGTVSIAGQYLVINWQSGLTVSTLWQYQGGMVTDFLSWAWSAPNGPAPTTFDSAMNTKGMTEYEFVTCIPGRACKFNI